MLLLERDDQLDSLDRALRQAAAGAGQIALVSGEAGIGKTSLVERFAELRRNLAQVLWGRCESLFTPQPLGALHDIADQLPGELRDLLRDTINRQAIFGSFLNTLQHSAAPLIVVFEDVHWADAATLDLLKFLGRRWKGVRALLVLTYRDDEIDRTHPLWSVLGTLPAEMVRRLSLPPLSEAAVAALAAGSSRRAAREVHALTHGNPFFVVELLASADQGVPATIRDATLARAVHLSPPARAVLEVCAVAPNRIDRWLLDATLDAPAAAIDECARSGLLVVEPDAVRFRHELARLSVEAALPAVHAESLHGRILRALLDRGLDVTAPARIVHHALNARDGAAVCKYAPLAARHAARLGAHCQAFTHYGTALQFTDPTDIDTRVRLIERRAYESYLTGEIETAVALRQEALALRRRQGRAAKEGDNLRWLSRLAWFLGQHGTAMAQAKESIQVLEALPPGPELAMAYSNRAQLHMLADEHDEAISWARRALSLADGLSLTEVEIHALNNLGTAQLQAGEPSGWENLERSLHLALQHDMHEHVGRAYTNLSWQSVSGRDYGRAAQAFEAGISYCTERELDSWTLYMLGARARFHVEQGRWDQAVEDAEAVLRSSRTAMLRITPLLALGLVRIRRGDSGGNDLLDEARALALAAGEVMRVGPMAAARAEAAWLRGSKDECLKEASAGFELALRHCDRRLMGQLSFWIWRVGGTPPYRPAASDPFELQIAGEWPAAAAQWERLGCPYEEALALAEGDGDAKLRALAILDRLGAPATAAMLRRSLRADGVRHIPRGARPATKRNPAGLTVRELDILRQLAGGFSNREIGQRLSISAKTVDHHVSAVLAKLEAGSREEAVSRAIARGFIGEHGEVAAPT
jgi:DNA-binding CsgD family transcriptional regulator/Tfp pilus assembly protein PilF